MSSCLRKDYHTDIVNIVSIWGIEGCSQGWGSYCTDIVIIVSIWGIEGCSQNLGTCCTGIVNIVSIWGIKECSQDWGTYCTDIGVQLFLVWISKHARKLTSFDIKTWNNLHRYQCNKFPNSPVFL